MKLLAIALAAALPLVAVPALGQTAPAAAPVAAPTTAPARIPAAK